MTQYPDFIELDPDTPHPCYCGAEMRTMADSYCNSLTCIFEQMREAAVEEYGVLCILCDERFTYAELVKHDCGWSR